MSGSYAPIFRWMKTLHRTLMLEDAGHTIIGIATLLSVFEIVTGYCLWWKFAKGQMKVSAARGDSRWTGFCRSLNWSFPTKRWGGHVAAGFWSGIPLLLMALTGLTWSFGWYADLVYGLFDTSGSGDLFHTIIAIHAGGWGGLMSRIIWMATVILGGLLSVTGYIIFFRKKSHGTNNLH